MDYDVKDGGLREAYASGMVREPVAEDKPLYTLIPTEFLRRVAMHMTRSLKKYPRDNWRLANSEDEWLRMRDSAWRHFVDWSDGKTDEDHAAATCFNIFAAEYVRSKLDVHSS